MLRDFSEYLFFLTHITHLGKSSDMNEIYWKPAKIKQIKKSNNININNILDD